MGSRVGILVDGGTLRRALRGHRTNERIALYRQIARDEGIDIIVFSIEGVRVGPNKVIGYVPTAKGWKKERLPIPKVIHKRVLYRSNRPLGTVKRLTRRGIRFVNPHLIQNKANMSQLLSADPAIAPHLPATTQYQWKRLKEALAHKETVILKPRIGSVGQGIVKVEAISAKKVQITGRKPTLLTMGALRRRLRRHMGRKRYLLQQYIPLARCDGSPFDLRVPVQRDGSGAWCVPGMVAKVAGKHPFLTNVAQGGRAIPAQKAIVAAFGPSRCDEVVARVEALAKRVAERIAQKHPDAADLGLDIGVDVDGKAWLIEVNTRDQRITFHQAGLHDVLRAVYSNPLMYCLNYLSS